MDGAIRGDENGTVEEKEGDREVTSPTFQPRLRPRSSHRPNGHQSSCTKRLTARPTDGNKPRLLGPRWLGRARGPTPGRPGPGPRCVKARSRRNSDCLRGGNATSRHVGAAISHASQGELSRSCHAAPRHATAIVLYPPPLGFALSADPVRRRRRRRDVVVCHLATQPAASPPPSPAAAAAAAAASVASIPSSCGGGQGQFPSVSAPRRQT